MGRSTALRERMIEEKRLDDLKIFLAADGSQIEVRELAEVSGDRLLIKQFRDAARAVDPSAPSSDIHCLVGNMLTGWPVERIKAEKNLRKMVKNMHFGIIFGLGRNALYPYVVAKIRAIDGRKADLTGITPEKLGELYDKYFEVYTGVKAYIDLQRKYVETRGYVETLFRFRREIFKDDASRTTYWGNQCINCVDYETDILTKRGWLRGDRIRKTDLCLTETGWQRPIDVRRWPDYKGPVHEWKSRSFSAVTTPNHRWKVFVRRKGDATLVTKDISKGKSDNRIHRTIPEISVEETYSDLFVRLCGWALTDGHYVTKNSKGIMILQSKGKTVSEIRTLMRKLKVESSGGNGKKQFRWYVGGDLGKTVRILFPDRALSIEFISKLSRRQAILLVETMMKGDGDGEKTPRRLCCGTSHKEGMANGKKKADMFQMLCAWAGFATTVKERLQKKPALIKKTGQLVVSKEISYIISILRRTKAQVYPKQEKIIEGNGVWCPTFADDAAWVARREGTTYITKNTPVQGTAHQFLLMALALLELKPKTYHLLQECIMEVHDALFFKVRLGDLVEARAQLMHLFEVGAKEYAENHFQRKLRVPLLAESSAGFCMGSMVEYGGEKIAEFLPKWRKKQAEVEATPWENFLPETLQNVV